MCRGGEGEREKGTGKGREGWREGENHMRIDSHFNGDWPFQIDYLEQRGK